MSHGSFDGGGGADQPDPACRAVLAKLDTNVKGSGQTVWLAF